MDVYVLVGPSGLIGAYETESEMLEALTDEVEGRSCTFETDGLEGGGFTATINDAYAWKRVGF